MLRYNDFSVKIRANESGTPEVHIESPAGNTIMPFELPLEVGQTLQQKIGLIRTVTCRQVVPHEISRGIRFGDQRGPQELTSLSEIGTLLFDAIFRDRALELLDTSCALSTQNDTGLRLRFCVDPTDPSLVDVSTLPWELLFRPADSNHLCLSSRIQVVRYLEVARPCPTVRFRPPFRVLMVISNPQGVGGLDLDREKRLIRESWGQRTDVQIDFLEKPTQACLQRQLGAAEYHVLHFMGHGDYDPQSGQGVLILEDEQGQVDTISGKSLGILLADEPSLRLVFLNACNTAQMKSDSMSSEDPLAGMAAALVMSGVPIVLAMQYPISDQAAIAFSQKFYELLPQHHAIDWVVGEARKQVSLKQADDQGMEWMTPALFMRSPTGVVFEPAYGRRELSADQSNAIARLNVKVNRRWVEQKLDVDIPIKPPIELNKELAPKSLQRTFGADDRNQIVPAGKTIGTVFDESERSLLILGEPGFGKSTSLFALAQYLIRLFDQDPTQPVPVVLFLSTWSQSRLSIREWAAREVLELYRTSDRSFREWLDEGRIVLLLDGLDSVADHRRAECVEAINQFAKEQISATNYCGVAVCCRFEEYDRLPDRLDLQGAIQLQPLTEGQIKEFLGKFGTQMAGLQEFIESDPQLLEDAKTPLVLGMLSVAYHLAPEKFAQYSQTQSQASTPTTHDGDTRKQLLISTYIDRVFEDQKDRPQPFSRPHLLKGLGWLARQMKQHHRPVFQLEHLQPSWLEGLGQRLLFGTLHGLALGMLLASILSVIWTVSAAVDTYTNPVARAADAHLFFLVPIWGVVVSLAGMFWLESSPSSSRAAPRRWFRGLNAWFAWGAYVLALYTIWMALWIAMAFWIHGTQGPWFMWLKHSITGGISVSVLYGLKSFWQNDRFTGTTEVLYWNWRRAAAGAGFGLLVGLLLWSVYFLIYWSDEYPARMLTRNLWLYPPFASATGLLFGGFNKRESTAKTMPNEGILLSFRNSIKAMIVIGGTLAVALIPMLMMGFSHRFSSWWQNLLFLSLASAMLGLGAAGTTFAWFGGLDVIRHYCLRLVFAINGQLPWRLGTYFGQMADLSLLQRIGGGYMFRNNLLQEHFENAHPTAESGSTAEAD